LLGILVLSSEIFLFRGFVDGTVGWIRIRHFCLGRPRCLSFGVKYNFVNGRSNNGFDFFLRPRFLGSGLEDGGSAGCFRWMLFGQGGSPGSGMIVEFLAQVSLFLGIHILTNSAVSHASNVNLSHKWWLVLWCGKAVVK
jgi:hypothetical protein